MSKIHRDHIPALHGVRPTRTGQEHRLQDLGADGRSRALRRALQAIPTVTSYGS